MKTDKKEVVIFGTSQLASLAHFYFTHDSDYTVKAFTVDKDYLDADTYEGKPVVAFEDVEKEFSPDEYEMFIPISFKKMSHVRREKYEAAKEKGYTLASYVSSKATTWPDLDIGDNCFIFEDNTIQPFVKIGNNCVLWSGNHIGHHTVIKNHVFITSHVVISGACTIEDHCFFGVNATVRDEAHIAEATLVAMGANILKDTNKYEIHLGQKSKLIEKKSLDLDSLSYKSKG
jgi:sugar O-acyltransferase (sialic acid O-acetyltransferase NeuD family)